jgi:hypothetical protein
MKNVYYTSTSFLGNLLCDLLFATDRKFNILDRFRGSDEFLTGKSKRYVVSVDKLSEVEPDNAAAILCGGKLDDLIIVDRDTERTWIPNLSTVASIYYFIELDWRGGNLEEIAKIQHEYPQIEQFICLKNHPPEHDDVDWNAWRKIEPDFKFPTLEISCLDLPNDVAMDILADELTFSEYMKKFANTKEKRQIDRWLTKTASQFETIECLKGVFAYKSIEK